MQKDYFLRQNALDKFNKDSLEFHILSNLDQTQKKIKKKVSIFYKRVEGILNLDYPDLNNMSRIFSYKSTLIRDEGNKYLMELFTPILTTKGEANLLVRQAMIKNPRNYREFQDIKQRFEKQKIKPKRDKMFSALQVENLVTDESMA